MTEPIIRPEIRTVVRDAVNYANSDRGTNHSVALFITGPAAAGKTLCANLIADMLRDRNVTVLDDVDSALPPSLTTEEVIHWGDGESPSSRWVLVLTARCGVDEFCARVARGDADAAAQLHRHLRVYELTPRDSGQRAE